MAALLYALRLIDEIKGYLNLIFDTLQNVFILTGNDLQGKAISLSIIVNILIFDHRLCYSNFAALNPFS